MYGETGMTTDRFRGNIPDHTPTSAEWDRLEELFPESQFKRVVETLKLQDNISVEVCRNPEFEKPNVDLMNARLEDRDSVFRLVSTYTRRFNVWDEIRLERVRPTLHTPGTPCK